MELILHHYDDSSFSEKVRLILGLKRLAWSSVEIPDTAPKPDYTPLTGGYRRTPALQIGADVYCDTRLIADVLEARSPTPSLFPGPEPERIRALADALAPWAEGQMFWPLALYVTGVHADRFPSSFHADRARLHGKPVASLGRVRAAAERQLAQLRPQLGWLEDLLAGDRRFVLGDAPSLADFTLYQGPWFLERIGGPNAGELLGERTRAWMARVAAIGHGERTPLGAEDALAAARDTEPAPLAPVAGDGAEGARLGDRVVVAPLTEVSPAEGSLVALDAKRIVIRTGSARTGVLHVHFPRVGYRIRTGAAVP